MKKTVEFTINISWARTMLKLAGFNYDEISRASDDEIFEKVLTMTDCYGATFEVKEPT